MINFYPFSIDLLLNISMYSVIAAMLNNGFAMALNTSKSLKDRIEEKDLQSGLYYKPDKYLGKLKAGKHYKTFTRNISLFTAILIVYLIIVLLFDLFPQIGESYSVLVDLKSGLKVVFANDNKVNNLAIGIVDYLGYQFTFSKLVMLIAALLSWIELLCIIVFYFLTIKTFRFYALLLK